jgi:mono/diheme cytochrome c family protein
MWLLVTAMTVMVIFAACEPGDPGRSTGSYPIDIFQEMHYNQSYKAQEPPRISAPEDSIPVSGGYFPAPAKADAAALVNPLAGAPGVLEHGALLFKQNCSMCHGLTAEGDGVVGLKFADYPVPQPPAFTDSRIAQLTVGEAFASLSNGAGAMPAFQGLLSEVDRWALVALIEASASERAAELAKVNTLGTGETAITNEIRRALHLDELRAADQARILLLNQERDNY